MAFAERLESLGRKKHDLELAITMMEKQPQPDEVALKRLKREKLALKDQIFSLLDGQAPPQQERFREAAE